MKKLFKQVAAVLLLLLIASPVFATTNLNDFRSGIKSIQRGTHTMTTTSDAVTISSVNTTHAFVIISYSAPDSSDPRCIPAAYLTNSTTLTLTNGDAFAGNLPTVAWQVIELVPQFYGAVIKSVQSGQQAMTSTSVNVPLSSVNTNKSFSIVTWESPTNTNAHKDAVMGVITGATTLNLSQGAAGTTAATANWTVIEFY
jgi:hypothetical protein